MQNQILTEHYLCAKSCIQCCECPEYLWNLACAPKKPPTAGIGGFSEKIVQAGTGENESTLSSLVSFKVMWNHEDLSFWSHPWPTQACPSPPLR